MIAHKKKKKIRKEEKKMYIFYRFSLLFSLLFLSFN
jgi:hypothetical protein